MLSNKYVLNLINKITGEVQLYIKEEAVNVEYS